MKSPKKASSGIGALKRVSPFLSMDAAIKIYRSIYLYISSQTLINAVLDVWDGLTQQLSEKH